MVEGFDNSALKRTTVIVAATTREKRKTEPGRSAHSEGPVTVGHGYAKNPGVYILGGQLGVGKTTAAQSMLAPFGLEGITEHEFLTPEEMGQRVSSAKMPIEWDLESSDGLAHYLIDGFHIINALGRGENVLFVSGSTDAANHVIEFLASCAEPKYAHLMALLAKPYFTKPRTIRQYRSAEEVEARYLRNINSFPTDLAFARRNGSVIRNWKPKTPVDLDNLAETEIREEAVRRLEHLMYWTGKNHPSGLPVLGVHDAYVRAVETVISGGESSLREGMLVTIPEAVVNRYSRWRADSWRYASFSPFTKGMQLPSLPCIETARVTQVTVLGGVKEVRLQPEENGKLTKKPEYKAALFGVLNFYLNQEELPPADIEAMHSLLQTDYALLAGGTEATVETATLECRLTDHSPLYPEKKIKNEPPRLYAIRFVM